MSFFEPSTASHARIGHNRAFDADHLYDIAEIGAGLVINDRQPALRVLRECVAQSGKHAFRSLFTMHVRADLPENVAMTAVTADPSSGAERQRASGGSDFSAIALVRQSIEQRLTHLSAPEGGLATRMVSQAMSYALLAPGKRVRPVLTVLACVQQGGHAVMALDSACAIELVHTASLILDDLPCMDDAALRRGLPTTHRAHGEAAALLAAIGLLNRAYALLAQAPGLSDAQRLALVARLTAAVGVDGLIDGQALDLRERIGFRGSEAVDELNRLKTGSLFAAAMEFGAICAGADDARIEALAQAGLRIGLAFQTMDDLLDQTCASAQLGKDANKDANKPSIVSLDGQDAARLRVRGDVEQALALAAAQGGSIEPLRGFLGDLFGAVLT